MREQCGETGVIDLAIFYGRNNYLLAPDGHMPGNLFATFTEGLKELAVGLSGSLAQRRRERAHDVPPAGGVSAQNRLTDADWRRMRRMDQAFPGLGARIGVIYPASGLADMEYYRLCPAGVSVHLTRSSVPNDGGVTLADVLEVAEGRQFTQLAEDLATVRPHALAWMCTSGSFSRGAAWDAELCRTLMRAWQLPGDDDLDRAGRPRSTPSACAASRWRHPTRVRSWSGWRPTWPSMGSPRSRASDWG